MLINVIARWQGSVCNEAWHNAAHTEAFPLTPYISRPNIALKAWGFRLNEVIFLYKMGYLLFRKILCSDERGEGVANFPPPPEYANGLNGYYFWCSLVGFIQLFIKAAQLPLCWVSNYVEFEFRANSIELARNSNSTILNPRSARPIGQS